jgi:hypothetical protein
MIAVPLTCYLVFVALRHSLRVDGANTVITTVALGVSVVVVWIVSQAAFGTPQPDMSQVCEGIPDSGGNCIPWESLPPGMRERMATPGLVP